MREALRNRNVSLLMAARLVSSSGDWLYVVALSIAIYKYSNGNSFLVGMLWIVRLIPMLLLSPFGGALADRIGHARAMIFADVGRGLLVIVLAIGLNASTWAIIYPLAFLITSQSAVFRPASIALIPNVVSKKEDLLAANAVVMQAESLAMILGCFAGGAIAGTGAITQLLWVEAVTYGFSAISIRLIRTRSSSAKGEEHSEPSDLASARQSGWKATFQIIRQRPVLLFSLAIMTMPELAQGALFVWMVTYAEHTIHIGNAGVGYMYGALGAGELVGGLIASRLSESVRLDSLLAGSITVGGICLALFPVWPVAGAALTIIGLIGLAEVLQYAAQETLLQQSVPDSILGRVSGTMDAYFFNMVLVGNAVSGPLAGVVGLTQAIIIMGIIVVLASAASWWYYKVQTSRAPRPEMLARVPALANLPEAVREWAVRRMMKEEFPAGTVVVRQGDVGDRFYVIASGTADIEVANEGVQGRSQLHPGDFFGEIALLHNVPRTATVRAHDRLTVFSLEQSDFFELRDRAADVHESLLEAANARLQNDANLKLALTART
ncbi:MAG TPA: MFS transporter [Chloroflexota bacterium]